MQGNIQDLATYMRGASSFNIPVYQRNYDWHIDNCKRLIEDLITIEQENLKSHFFGSIVVKPGDFSLETVIIDGQQRITTISLLLLAIRNWMVSNNKEGNILNPHIIDNYFLMNKLARTEEKYKLKSNPRDYEAYKKLFGNDKFFVETSNVTRNYECLYKLIDEMPIDIEQLWSSIEKLEVMIVNLNSPDDDPQLIFESLNSTGLDLTNADKIRNFLLMNENQVEQQYLFINYWGPIEERTSFELSEFFRYYLTVKQSSQPTRAKIYEIFKDYYKEKWDNKRDFFNDLNEYSLAYNQILSSNTDSKEINAILYRINQLDVTVVRPFLMAILKDYNNADLPKDEVVKTFTIVENYITRRMIAQIPSNSLNKTMATLYRDMNNFLKSYSEENYASNDIIAYILLNKKRSGIFPTDEDVESSLKSRNMYNVNIKFRTYFFERLENYDHIEALNIFEGIQNQDYSVEHIMPQKLSDKWRTQLGSNYNQIHKTYLNNIGNLTLTGYNSKYSNKSFDYKKTTEKGFNESHFVFLNGLPKEKDFWKEDEIIERRDQIIERAKVVWEYPASTFEPVVQEPDLYVFDGEEPFTNYKINGYVFMDDEYHESNSWKKAYLEVVSVVVKTDPDKTLNYAKTEGTYGLELMFLDKPNPDYTEVFSGIYVKHDISNWRKTNFLKQLFDAFDIEYDALQIDATPPEE